MDAGTAERPDLSEAAGDTTLADMFAAREAVLQEENQPREVFICGAAAVAAVQAQHQNLANEVAEAARLKYLPEGVEFTPWPAFIVVDVLTQVVAGTNFFFKVQVSAPSAAAEFVWLRVFESLFGDPPQLVSLRTGEAAAGPLAYF